MAKKKAKAASETEVKQTVISMKGTAAWREWLQRGAKHCRTDTAKMIDAAVLEYLKRRGFTEEPPER